MFNSLEVYKTSQAVYGTRITVTLNKVRKDMSILETAKLTICVWSCFEQKKVSLLSWGTPGMDRPVNGIIVVVANVQTPGYEYHQVSNTSRTLVGKNKIVDHSDVVRAAPDLIPGINSLGKDNCKAGRETLKFWPLVRLILEIWR